MCGNLFLATLIMGCIPYHRARAEADAEGFASIVTPKGDASDLLSLGGAHKQEGS